MNHLNVNTQLDLLINSPLLLFSFTEEFGAIQWYGFGIVCLTLSIILALIITLLSFKPNKIIIPEPVKLNYYFILIALGLTMATGFNMMFN